MIMLSFIFASGKDLSDLPGDDEDIIGYWIFDEGTGENTTDLANGKTMVLGTSSSNEDQDPIWTEGIEGKALHFDGDDDVAMVRNFNLPSSEMTMSFWINTSWTVEGRVPISYANIYETNEFMLEDPGDLKVHIRGLTRDTDVSFNDGKWHNIVLTWRVLDGDLRIYKDTKEEFSGILAVENPIRGGGTLVIGNDQDEVGGGFDADQAFNGTIDELLIMDTVLEDDDILDIFEWVLPPPEVIEATPEGGRHPNATMINITFNVDMDRSSVEEAFSILPEINGTFRWMERSFSFIPDEDLGSDTEYKVMISKEAKDIWGRKIKDDIQIKFKTEKIEEPAPVDDDDTTTDDDTTDDEGTDKEDEKDNTATVMMVLALLAAGMIAIILALAVIAKLNHRED